MNNSIKKHPRQPSGDSLSRLTLPQAVFGQPVATTNKHIAIRDLAQTAIDVLVNAQAIPLSGKAPYRGHRWRTEKFRATPGLQDAAPEVWEQATGYGLLAVPGSDLYSIDSDSLDIVQPLLAAFPDIFTTPMTFSGDPGRAIAGRCHFFIRLTLPEELPGRISLKGINPQGKQIEIASLRHLDYVVGPGSLHPASGRRYSSNNVATVRLFNKTETTKLLALFNTSLRRPGKPAPTIISVRRDALDSTTLDQLTKTLHIRGYRANGQWLNGPCIHPDNHTSHDKRSSFGIDIYTGVGHCFRCGNFSPAEVVRAFGIDSQNVAAHKVLSSASQRPLTFVGELSNPDEGIRAELNIAAELIRQGYYQSSRLFDLLCHHSAAHGGQRTYRTAELISVGKQYKLTQDEVKKAIRQMTDLGALIKVARGVYHRVGVQQLQAHLGLDDRYAAAYLPLEAYQGSIANYTGAILLAIEHYFPQSPIATQRIADAAGLSRRSIYAHENALGVQRSSTLRQIPLAPATGDPSFIGVFNERWQQPQSVKDISVALEMAQDIHGHVVAYSQSPAERSLPSLHQAVARRLAAQNQLHD